MSNLQWRWKNEQHLNIDLIFDHQMSLSKGKIWSSYGKLKWNVIIPNVAKRPQNITPIFVILMYLFWSSPIKIVSKEKRNLYVLVLITLKIVNPSSNGCFIMDANYIFSDTVSRTLSLCLSGRKPFSPSFRSCIKMTMLCKFRLLRFSQ